MSTYRPTLTPALSGHAAPARLARRLAGPLAALMAVLLVATPTFAAAPSAPALTAASDSGVSATDGITNVTLPTFTGTADPNVPVSLYAGSTLVGTGTANSSGNWSITLSTPVAIQGSLSYTASAPATAATVSSLSQATLQPSNRYVVYANNALYYRSNASSDATRYDLSTGASSLLGGSNAVNGASGIAYSPVTGKLYMHTPGYSYPGWFDAETLAGGSFTNLLGSQGSLGSHQGAVVMDPTATYAYVLYSANTDYQSNGITRVDLAAKTSSLWANYIFGSGLASAFTMSTDGTKFYVTDRNCIETVLVATQAVSTLSGSCATASFADGTAANARFNGPQGIAIDPSGAYLYVADTINNRIRRVTIADGSVITIAGSGSSGRADGVGTAATFAQPSGITVDPASGNIYVMDQSGSWFRRLSMSVSGSPTIVSYDTIAPTVDAYALTSYKTNRTFPVSSTARDNAGSYNSGIDHVDLYRSATPTPTSAYTKVASGTASGWPTNWGFSISDTVPADGTYYYYVIPVDRAGNSRAVPASPDTSTTVDTIPPAAPSTPVLAASSDSGASNSDGITNITNGLLYSGTAEANSTVRLYADGSTLLGTATTDGSGHWSVTTTTALGDGSHSITATATDPAGNTGPASASLTTVIDTVAPVAPSIPVLAPASDTGISQTDDLTMYTNGLVFTGTGAEANSTVRLYGGSTLLGSGVADGQGNWSVTTTVAIAANATTSITAKDVDVAGNVSAASASVTVTTDTVAPQVTGAPVLEAASDTGVSSTDRLTRLVNGLVFDVSKTSTDAVTLTLYNGSTPLGSVHVTGAGTFPITTTTALPANATSTVTVVATSDAGTSATSSGVAVTTDTLAPSGTVQTLSSTTGSMSVSIPFSASDANSVASVALYVSNSYGTDTSAYTKLGTFTTSPIAYTAPTEGTYYFYVVATDNAGNVEPVPATYQARTTVRLTPPGTPFAPQLAAASDTGVSNSDRITSVANGLVFTGGGADPGVTITVYAGTTAVGSALTDEQGNWAVTTTTHLADGTYAISAVATDSLGRSSANSTAASVTIDTTAPTAPTALALAAASDTGISSSDRLTNLVNSLVITGSADAGSAVALYDGAALIGSGTATSGGTFSITTTSPIAANATSSITATATDLAGNTSTSSAPLSITTDTIAPAAPGAPALDPASDTGISDSDQITNLSVVRISGSGAEPSGWIRLYAGSTVLGFTQADGSGNWAISAVSLPANATTLLVAKAVDAAGNESAASAGLLVTVRVGPPAGTFQTAPALDPASDTGVSASDGVTRLASNLLVRGTASLSAAGAHVELLAGPSPASLALVAVSAAPVAADGSWSATIAGPLPEGTLTLQAQLVDVAGNAGARSPSASLVIDLTAPVAPSIPVLAPGSDTGRSSSDGITRFTSGLVFTGTAEPLSTVTLYAGASAIGSAQTNAAGAWTITTTTPLPANATSTITATATDAAGNVSPVSAGTSVTTDTIAPLAPSAPAVDTTTNGDAPSGATNLLTGFVLRGTAEPGADVAISDGSNVLGTVRADGSGAYSLRVGATFSGPSTHSLSAIATDAAGNVSLRSATSSLEVLVAAPSRPSTPVLAPSSDSGASNSDDLTNITTGLVFGGTADPDDTVTLLVDGQTAGSAVADGAGTWSIVESTTLADGEHIVKASALDAYGNPSPVSGALTVTVKTQAPAPTALALSATSDTGLSSSDGLTKLTSGLVFVAKADPGATVTLYVAGEPAGSATVGGDGSVAITSTTTFAANATTTVAARETDLAGNVSPESAPFSVTTDTITPVAPGTPVLAPSDDTGRSNSDGITSLTMLHFSGTGPTDMAILLQVNGRTLASTRSDGSGVWATTLSLAANSTNLIAAVALDAAGNESAPSASLSVTVDTLAPPPPSAPTLDPSSDTGSSSVDHLTRLTNGLLFTGTAEPGADVKLYGGSNSLLIGEGIADASGAYAITTTVALPANATTQVYGAATDVAGNTGPYSPSTAITTDTIAPTSALGAIEPLYTTLSFDIPFTASEARVSVDLYETTSEGAPLASYTRVASTTTSPFHYTATSAGNHWFYSLATDAAGNVEALPATAEATTNVDVTAPDAPSVPTLDPASDTGSSHTDRLTRLTDGLLFTGTAQPGVTIHLYAGSTEIGSGSTDGTGVWAVTTSSPVPANTTSQISARADNGLLSNPSASISVTTDTIAPATPAAPRLDAASDTGISQSDGITRITSGLVFTGTAEPDAQVTLFADGSPVATGVADPLSGAYAVTDPEPVAANASTDFTVSATDVAGNVSASSLSFTVTTDTIAPAGPTDAPALAASSDTGRSQTDGVTRLTSGLVFVDGADEPADAVAVDLYVGNTLAGSAPVRPGSPWSVTASAVPAGVSTVSARYLDAAGNESVAGPSVTITVVPTVGPTSAPRLAAVSDTGLAGDDRTKLLTGLVFTGTTEPEADVTLSYLAGRSETVLGTARADETGAWTVTTAAPLPANAATVVELSVTDVAGNSVVDLSSTTVATDTSMPTTTIAGPTLSSSRTVDVILGASDANGDPDITGISLYWGPSGTPIDSYTLYGTFSLGERVSISLPADGSYGFYASASDAAGNTTNRPTSPQLTTQLDTVAPAAPSAPLLAPADDSGPSASDGITNLTSGLVFTGTAEPGSTVRLYRGTTLVGTTQATSQGTYAVTTGVVFAEGTYSMSATATDAAGNVSTSSDGTELRIDVSAPVSAADPLPLAINTLDVPVSYSGSDLFGIASVELYVATDPATPIADYRAVGSFSSSPAIYPAPGEGPLYFYTRATDFGGNAEAAPATYQTSTVVDTTPPSTPSVPVLASSSDTGASNSDRITSLANGLVFSGTADPGTTVSLYVGTKAIGTVVADGNGRYMITTSVALPLDATSEIVARSYDLAGNASPDAAPLAVSVDRTAPVSTIGAMPATQNSPTVTIPVSAADAFSVASTELYASTDPAQPGTAIGVTANGSLPWTAPATGTYYFRAVSTDLAGNRETMPAAPEASIFVATVDLEPATPEGRPFAPGSLNWLVVSGTGAANEASGTGAPSGSATVDHLTGPGTIAVSSALFPVKGGAPLRVSGSLRLSGHGATLELCFLDVHGSLLGCPSVTTLGNIAGSTVQAIDWSPFAVELTAPADATRGQFQWTVGSDAWIDALAISFPKSATTQVTVDTVISVDAPALLDFGHAVPGDEPTVDSIVTVTTNASAGYDLTATATDLTGAGTDRIAVSNLAVGVDGGLLTAFADGISLELAAESHRTAEAGTAHALHANLAIPFVASGTYRGSVAFLATAR